MKVNYAKHPRVYKIFLFLIIFDYDSKVTHNIVKYYLELQV